jgi:hypothetical protein
MIRSDPYGSSYGAVGEGTAAGGASASGGAEIIELFPELEKVEEILEAAA